jgi:hypothetical protein
LDIAQNHGVDKARTCRSLMVELLLLVKRNAIGAIYLRSHVKNNSILASPALNVPLVGCTYKTSCVEQSAMHYKTLNCTYKLIVYDYMLRILLLTRVCMLTSYSRNGGASCIYQSLSRPLTVNIHLCFLSPVDCLDL